MMETNQIGKLKNATAMIRGFILNAKSKSELDAYAKAMEQVISGAVIDAQNMLTIKYMQEDEEEVFPSIPQVEEEEEKPEEKEPGEPMFTLTGQDRHGVLIKNATKTGATPAMVGDGIDTAYPSSDTRRGRVQKEACNTITTHGTSGVLTDIYPVRIRKLTPKECWRLQGFSDEQFEKAAAVNSNTQLYKQAGNAVTVNVAEAIGKHIVGIMHGGEYE